MRDLDCAAYDLWYASENYASCDRMLSKLMEGSRREKYPTLQLRHYVRRLLYLNIGWRCDCQECTRAAVRKFDDEYTTSDEPVEMMISTRNMSDDDLSSPTVRTVPEFCIYKYLFDRVYQQIHTLKNVCGCEACLVVCDYTRVPRVNLCLWAREIIYYTWVFACSRCVLLLSLFGCHCRRRTFYSKLCVLRLEISMTMARMGQVRTSMSGSSHLGRCLRLCWDLPWIFFLLVSILLSAHISG